MPWAQDTGRQGAAIAAEIQVGAVNVLYRQTQVGEVLIAADFDAFQQLDQRFASVALAIVKVPGRLLAGVDHVVAVECRHRHEADIRGLQVLSERPVLLDNLVKARF